MTLQDVEDRIAEIKAVDEGDDGAKHAREDALYVAVLEAIVRDEPGDVPKVLARAALAARQIEFARWCE